MDSRINGIINSWEQAGRKPTAEELCAGCPELAREVSASLDGLRSTDSSMGKLGASIEAYRQSEQVTPNRSTGVGRRVATQLVNPIAKDADWQYILEYCQ